MKMRGFVQLTASAALLVMLALFAGCDSNAPKPPEAKPEPKPPEQLTGRAAFQKTFIAARNYAADVKPFRIESTPSPDGNGQEGKSAIWRASFASAIQKGVKPFFWSGSNAPDAPARGVSPGNEDVYNPSNASTQVFDVAFLKSDSDAAFAEAQKHGGEKILEPQHQRTYLARHLWRFAGRRQADGRGERLDRRVYPRGEVGLRSSIGLGKSRKKNKSTAGFYFGCSACFIWSSIEAKKRHSTLAGAIAPLSVYGSPRKIISATEYCRRRRSVADCALSSSSFAERRSEIKRPAPPGLPVSSLPGSSFLGSSFLGSFFSGSSLNIYNSSARMDYGASPPESLT